MEEFYTEIAKIGEFPKFEAQLVHNKTSNILSKAKSASITAMVQPSNLLHPLRLGERFAPDSCVQGSQLRYILGNTLIEAENSKCPYSSSRNSFQSLNSQKDMVIPDLIVRERPGITHQKLSSVQVPEEVSAETDTTKTLKQTLDYAKNPTQKTLKPKATRKQTQSVKNLTKKKPVKKSPARKSNLKKKVHRVPAVKETFEDSESPKKTVTWKQGIDADLVSMYPRYFSRSKSESEGSHKTSDSKGPQKPQEPEEPEEPQQEEFTQSQLEEEYKAKKREHLEKHKAFDKSEESLQKLKAIVLEESNHSSQASRYQQTYGDLEKELQSIREMLSEKPENSPYSMSYSPDLEEDQSFELSPRFPD